MKIYTTYLFQETFETLENTFIIHYDIIPEKLNTDERLTLQITLHTVKAIYVQNIVEGCLSQCFSQTVRT